MADMALVILGADGGKFAILSASPDAANQNAWIAAMKEALKDPKYAKLEAGRHRLRQRPVRGELQPGPGAGRQVPGHEADHGADLGRHRGGRQGACRTKASATRSRSAASACPSEMVAYTHERLRA